LGSGPDPDITHASPLNATYILWFRAFVMPSDFCLCL